ncbi:MAG: hybrid sensor histidine kinase/response regulator, partial [Chloroflexi bacterium]
LFFYGLAVLVWLADRWSPNVSRWTAAVGLSVLVGLGVFRLNGPEYLSLLGLPTALAALLIGLRAAWITAGLQTLLLFLARFSPAPPDVTTTALAGLSIWSMAGLMTAIYRPRYRMSEWFRNYFLNARQALEEARNQKAELVQTLEDLSLANRQLTLLSERLETLQMIAEEAQQAKTAFVAKVSHELRTPLNMIIGIVDVLTETPDVYDQPLPPALLEDLEIVRRNCDHLSSMINDILDLSQTETGRLVLHREWVDLPQEINNALTVVHPLMEKKSLTLTLDLAADLPPVYCDRTRIRQVILNLLSNAARYTDSGGITVQARTEGRYVQVSITDTGPGINAEDAGKIFDPFYQSANGQRQGRGGSGLGLSISKQFIERHQGEIWVESEPGVGSTFAFKLPISPTTPPSAGPARWLSENWLWYERPHRPHLPQSPYKHRIVVYDQNEGLLPLLEPYTDTVEIVRTSNVGEIDTALKGYPAHAVLVNGDSLEAIQPVAERLMHRHPDTPVIGTAFPPRLDIARRAGAVNHLTKPVTLEALKEATASLNRPLRQILVIDDDVDMQKLLYRMLKTIYPELDVSTTGSGQSGLDTLRRGHFDLMLLDITLPDMTGWQVLSALHQHSDQQDIPPVIIISAEDSAARSAYTSLLSAAFGRGISGPKLLRAALELSAVLLNPEAEPGPGPE